MNVSIRIIADINRNLSKVVIEIYVHGLFVVLVSNALLMATNMLQILSLRVFILISARALRGNPSRTPRKFALERIKPVWERINLTRSARLSMF